MSRKNTDLLSHMQGRPVRTELWCGCCHCVLCVSCMGLVDTFLGLVCSCYCSCSLYFGFTGCLRPILLLIHSFLLLQSGLLPVPATSRLNHLAWHTFCVTASYHQQQHHKAIANITLPINHHLLHHPVTALFNSLLYSTHR